MDYDTDPQKLSKYTPFTINVYSSMILHETIARPACQQNFVYRMVFRDIY